MDNKNIIAVFDFDKTIISCDSGYEFIRAALLKTSIRKFFFFFTLPISIFLVAFPKTRIFGISIFFWIATAGAGRSELNSMFKEFSDTFFISPSNRPIYKQALVEIKKHQDMGHTILIISGSPEKLVKFITDKVIPSKVNVIGSQEMFFLGGMILRRYCLEENKIKMAEHRGFLNYNWKYGYSDSHYDIPILARCSDRYLINPTRTTIHKVNRALGKTYKVLTWK